MCAICRAFFCHNLPKLTSFLGNGVQDTTWRCTKEAPCHLRGIHPPLRGYGSAKAAAIYPDELIVPWVQCLRVAFEAAQVAASERRGAVGAIV